MFGNKRNDSPTVQPSAMKARPINSLNQSVRLESKTYKSSIMVYNAEPDAVSTANKKIE